MNAQGRTMAHTGEIKKMRHGFYRVMLYRHGFLIFDFELDDYERANAQVSKWQSLQDRQYYWNRTISQ